MTKLVLGLSTDHGDSAAALIGPDGPVAAIAEERLNRQKHSARFPSQAIAHVMDLAGAKPEDLAAVAIARDPKANWAGKLSFLARNPRQGLRTTLRRFAVHRSVRQHTLPRVAQALAARTLEAPLFPVEHHLAHAASAFYWSPYERCGFLTVDGAGDFATTTWGRAQAASISTLGKTLWPHSLGVFYTALCQFIGFDRYGEEFKVMGLSAYGSPSFLPAMRRMVRFDPDKGIRLNLKYFRHHQAPPLRVKDGEVSIARAFTPLLEVELGAARERNEPLEQRHRDIAASLQKRYEEVFLELVRHVHRQTGMKQLVLAGGCALNSVANGRMLEETPIESIYIQPAATDDGTAVGAAHWVLHDRLGVPRPPPQNHAYLGAEWDEENISAALKSNGRSYVRLDRQQLLERAVGALKRGSIMGWFQGREEWGPRALGNRSILCNPGWPQMKETLNARIKNREAFRPFAPVVNAERLAEVFEGTHEVPFMNIVYRIRPEWRERIAAVTHADGTGRVQTVERKSNELYYDLLEEFRQATGIPVLLNTSFNENEPIVHSPAQALACFERTEMDCLGIGPFWLEKESQ